MRRTDGVCCRTYLRYIWADGSMFIGEWVHGLRTGKGTLFNNTGKLAYTGDWKKDRFDGAGKCFYTEVRRVFTCHASDALVLESCMPRPSGHAPVRPVVQARLDMFGAYVPFLFSVFKFVW